MRKPFKFMMTFLAIAVSTAMTAAGAQDFDAIKKSVQPLLTGDMIQKITPMGEGLNEIVTDRGIYYTNKTGSVLLVNAVAIDTASKENLTEKSNNLLGSFIFKDLPLNNAIKVVRGDGSRKLVTFEDPNCGYCKKLMTEFSKMNNVTIYTFLTPILGGDSQQKAQAIWCSENQSKTWTDYMQANANITSTKVCKTPFENNLALYNKLRLRGTPAILFPSNTKVPGYLPLEQIESKLKG